QNITMTGRIDSSSPTTTMRVRNFDPRTPRRRSAKSLSRFRARMKVNATNNRKTSAERAAKNRSCWLVSGFRKGRSKEVCDRTMPNTTSMASPSRTNAVRRRRFSGSRLSKVMGKSSAIPQLRVWTRSSDRVPCKQLYPQRLRALGGRYRERRAEPEPLLSDEQTFAAELVMTSRCAFPLSGKLAVRRSPQESQSPRGLVLLKGMSLGEGAVGNAGKPRQSRANDAVGFQVKSLITPDKY